MKYLGRRVCSLEWVYYVMYADYEEHFGLLNHAMEIYHKMIEDVDYGHKKFAYKLYIAKISEHMGITKTRSVYEKALNSLFDDELVSIGLEYANVERRIGEIDRAREVYAFLSQYCEPELEDYSFWNVT